jgi:hypothetical protein
MSTWAEIRTEILTMLDIDTAVTTASDLRNLVDIKMKRKRDSLYNMRMPPSLFVSSQQVQINSTFQYIDIRGPGDGSTSSIPGFDLVNLWKPFTLMIATDENDPTTNADWNFVSHPTWLRQQFAARAGGDQRERNSYTIDYQDFLYLSRIPAPNEANWNAQLWYYKLPANITDISEPEIGPEFEELLTLGVVIQFPNRFSSEERLVLLQAYTQEYNNLLRDFLRQRRVGKIDSRFRPRERKSSSGYGAMNWGYGSTDPSN